MHSSDSDISRRSVSFYSRASKVTHDARIKRNIPLRAEVAKLTKDMKSTVEMHERAKEVICFVISSASSTDVPHQIKQEQSHRLLVAQALRERSAEEQVRLHALGPEIPLVHVRIA
jgi:hypothetical protein